MRTWVVVVLVVVGIAAVLGFAAAAGNGRDNTGETVRAQRWADDVCGTVGAWEGQIESIRDELRFGNWAARRNDGGTGDSVEGTLTLRGAVNRAIAATNETLQKGLKRAGTPQVTNGEEAAATLADWAQRTENDLVSAKVRLKQRPSSVSDALAALAAPVGALARSAVDGRLAFAHVAGLDPALAKSIEQSRNCRDLMKEKP